MQSINRSCYKQCRNRKNCSAKKAKLKIGISTQHLKHEELQHAVHEQDELQHAVGKQDHLQHAVHRKDELQYAVS